MSNNKTLPSHYDVVHDGRLVSVPRAELTLDERRRIIARLDAVAQADFTHADVLDIETNHALRRGEI